MRLAQKIIILELVQSLLNAGANPNIGDESHSALAQTSDLNTIQLLLAHKAYLGINRALLHASARGDIESAKQLIDSGAM